MEIGDIQKLVEAVGEQYAPPYDSPIENVFAYHLLKHISPSATLERQVEVDTPVGGFRLDFMLSDEDLSIGLECDGEKFHDPWRDEWRDAMILGTRLVSDILDYNTNRQPPNA